MTQNEALSIMKTGVNVFLTGEPGSGKTHTVNNFVAWLREHGVEPAVTASTGIAATHIGGMTIHSWSGIGVKENLTRYDLGRIVANKRVARRVRNARVLIIDEISMLGARTFATVDAACRAIRGSQTSFGGLSVILVGDFFQLPPIIRRIDHSAAENMLIAPGEAEPQFAFQSPVWQTVNPLVCYLSEQHRQEDAAFLELLSAVRNGTVSDSHRAALRARRVAVKVSAETTQLFSHNADVDRVNAIALARLPNEEQKFLMESRGAENIQAGLKRGCLSPETLALKIGARVMFTKNDISHRFVNGTLGVIAGFSSAEGYPIVKTSAGRTIIAEPAEWTVEDNGRILAQITQIPLRLAWAITVHKSQGMSLDAAHMDLSDAFEHGQGYVALSRVRTFAGLSLTGFNERALEVHPDIRAKDAAFRTASRAAQEEFSNIPPTELARRHNDFLHACGGAIKSQPKHDEEKTRFDDKSWGPKKAPRWERTLALARAGETFEMIALMQGKKINTIIDHFEELLKLGGLKIEDIQPLARKDEAVIVDIHDVFRELGSEKLKPIYDHFGGRVSYETIRLARLLYDKEMTEN